MNEKYPKIINDKLHKNAILVKHIEAKTDKYDKIIFALEETEKMDKLYMKKLIIDTINQDSSNKLDYSPSLESLTSIELFQTFIKNDITMEGIVEKLNENTFSVPELLILSKLINKGFNLIQNKQNKIDFQIIIHSDICEDSLLHEIDMITIYEDDVDIYNVLIMNYMNIPIDSFTNKYYDILRKQHRKVYNQVIKKLKKKFD